MKITTVATLLLNTVWSFPTKLNTTSAFHLKKREVFEYQNSNLGIIFFKQFGCGGDSIRWANVQNDAMNEIDFPAASYKLTRNLFLNEQLDFSTDAIFSLPTSIHKRQLPGQAIPFSCTHFSEEATVGRSANECHDLADGLATVSLESGLRFGILGPADIL